MSLETLLRAEKGVASFQFVFAGDLAALLIIGVFLIPSGYLQGES